MSARAYFSDAKTNNHRPVDYYFSVTSVAGGAVAPTFVEGDGFNGQNVSTVTSTGTFLTVTRNGVGSYTFKTADPFPGFVCVGVQIAAATPAGQLTANVTPATQNADNSWSFTVTCWNGASARELAAGDFLYINARLRNGTNTP